MVCDRVAHRRWKLLQLEAKSAASVAAGVPKTSLTEELEATRLFGGAPGAPKAAQSRQTFGDQGCPIKFQKAGIETIGGLSFPRPVLQNKFRRSAQPFGTGRGQDSAVRSRNWLCFAGYTVAGLAFVGCGFELQIGDWGARLRAAGPWRSL